MTPKSIAARATVLVLAVCLATVSACSMKPLDAHVTTTTAGTTVAELPVTTVPVTPVEPVSDLNGYVWSLRAPWADKLVL